MHRFQLGSTSTRLKQLEACLESLGMLISAGIPVDHALNLLLKQTRSPYLKTHITQLKKQLNRGRMLSQALHRTCSELPASSWQLIQLGERAGTLGQGLTSAAEAMRFQREMQSQLIGALRYPMGILLMSLCISFGILECVMPQFSKLYQDVGQQLPSLTQHLIQLSQHPWLFSMLSIISVAGLRLCLKHWAHTRYRSYIPLAGHLLVLAEQTQLLRGLVRLSSAHMSIQEAIETLRRSARWRWQATQLALAHRLLLKGCSVSLSFSRSTLLPPSIISLIEVGEQSGQLTLLLERGLHLLSDQFTQRLSTVKQCIEPVLMLLVGGLVSTIAAGLYLPIFQLGEVMQA